MLRAVFPFRKTQTSLPCGSNCYEVSKVLVWGNVYAHACLPRPPSSLLMTIYHVAWYCQWRRWFHSLVPRASPTSVVDTVHHLPVQQLSLPSENFPLIEWPYAAGRGRVGFFFLHNCPAGWLFLSSESLLCVHLPAVGGMPRAAVAG